MIKSFQFCQPKVLSRSLLVAGVFASTQLFATTTFNFTTGDVIIGFRKANLGGVDLVVDAGPISTFTNLAPNTKITITAYSAGQQLKMVGTNNVAWSAFAYFDNSVTPVSVQSTLFVSNPRFDLNTQTDPYYCDTASAQGQVTSRMKAIVAGAVNNANSSTTNTSTAVLVADSYNVNGTMVSYFVGLGPNLNFNDTFQADPEQVTAANFTTAGTASRADFYWLPPAAGSPNAKYLGYFELNTNGVMTYTAYPTATVVAPVITGFARVGTTNTVTFTTGSAGTYTLRATNSLGLGTALTNWPAVSSAAGTGGTISLQDVSSVANRFFTVTAQ
jgi:hypothetical protein